ncbi:MAG: polyprenyl synthetase family protein [Anaerolineales bacterium]
MSEAADASRFVNELLVALDGDLRLAAARVPGPRYAPVRDMIAYHLGWTGATSASRGKRIRPLLTLLSCAAAGGRWESALPAATGVELIHNFSLVHDDIQDRSETRRGRPTLWVQWGVPQAINTGDTLFVLARISTGRLVETGATPEQAIEAHRILDEACLALTLGQHLDLAFEDADRVSEEDYLEMVRGKTAALLEAACDVGALLASAAASRPAYPQFGRHLGMAFQILDDILGVWGEPGTTGKPTGDDLAARKKSFPVVFGLAHSPEFARLWRSGAEAPSDRRRMVEALTSCGALERARELARTFTDEALAALELASPAGDAGVELRELSQRLLQRRH